MLNSFKRTVGVSGFSFALLGSAFYAQIAVAEVACCRILSNGVLSEWESSRRCNGNGAETRRVGTGNYEVDFNWPLTDVRAFTKLATLDTQTTGSTAWMIGVADRSGDVSSVFVAIRNNNNVAVDAGFNLCLF